MKNLCRQKLYQRENKKGEKYRTPKNRPKPTKAQSVTKRGNKMRYRTNRPMSQEIRKKPRKYRPDQSQKTNEQGNITRHHNEHKKPRPKPVRVMYEQTQRKYRQIP